MFAYTRPYVSVTVLPHKMACSWLSDTKPIQLHAYTHVALPPQNNNQLANLTLIKQTVQNFLQRNNIQNAYVAIALAPPYITDYFVTHADANAKLHQLPVIQTNDTHWDYRYLYPHNEQNSFYVAGITHTALLQWQLMTIAARANCVAITPAPLATLNWYRRQNKNLRHTQLGANLAAHNNDPSALIHPDLITPHITCVDKRIDIEHEAPHLIAACGMMQADKGIL